MSYPLLERYSEAKSGNKDPLDLFLSYVAEKKLELYPAQEEAILELYSGKNVILNTPTGSGKSLVATALHFYSWVKGNRSVYTCPIKALVNEKFLSLCRDFGPEQVGMMTGDATVNRDAPILVCTAEILSNFALREGEKLPYTDIIMDEFHFYSDRERGVAWQIPLLTASKSRFLLMSATLGDTSFFELSLTTLNGMGTTLVASQDRPVPLDFRYQEISLQKTVQDLIAEKRAPIYLVNFTQRECAEEAQNLLSVDFSTKEEKQTISKALEGVKFSSPYGKEIQRFIKHGVGIHHAGLLPKYRVLIEKLAQQGLLKVICGTDTLGVGVNIPIRTVLFTKLSKYDGQKTGTLSVRDFKQIAGRAGRKGFDDQGTVVALAPEHVIENVKMDEKAKADPSKAKKQVKKKAPEGFVSWDRATFDRLIQSPPEALSSRFTVSHAMLLNVLSRPSGQKKAMQQIIKRSHEGPGTKKKLRKNAFQLFRSLVDRKIVEFSPLRVNIDLQDDFSLNTTLSLYLVDTLKLINPSDPFYAMDVLTVVESILENPQIILIKQLDRVKRDKIVELKAQGMDYDERMAELEKLEYPKPNREFIYNTFNEFSALHPWVGSENIRPKSIAREMWESYLSFSEYIREYDLERSEGILLRYLSDVYKTLKQTVPDALKNDELEEMVLFFAETIRQVDSSLLDEWERLRNSGFAPKDELPEIRRSGEDPVKLKRERTIIARNSIFPVIRALARGDFTAMEDGARLEKMLVPYWTDHSAILTSPAARNPAHLHLTDEGTRWKAQQVLLDREEHNDWCVEFELEWEAGAILKSLKILEIKPIS